MAPMTARIHPGQAMFDEPPHEPEEQSSQQGPANGERQGEE